MTPRFLDEDYVRIVYKRNPLMEVICQIRFPHCFKIEAEPPSAFQEKISAAYPLVECRDGLEIPAKLAGQQIRQSRTYSFFSVDRTWQLALAVNFLALSTTRYVKWDDFRDRLAVAIEALIGSYPIPALSRIGLRYSNVIDRDELGLTEAPWRDLVRPSALGLIAEKDEHNLSFEELTNAAVIRINAAKVRSSTSLVVNTETSSQALLLDNDFIIESQIEATLTEALSYANRLHDYSGPFFRWCIQDRLHAALQDQ